MDNQTLKDTLQLLQGTHQHQVATQWEQGTLQTQLDQATHQPLEIQLDQVILQLSLIVPTLQHHQATQDILQIHPDTHHKMDQATLQIFTSSKLFCRPQGGSMFRFVLIVTLRARQ